MCVCVCVYSIKRDKRDQVYCTCIDMQTHTQLCLICIVMYWGIVYLESHVVVLVLQNLLDHHTEGYE